MQRYFLLVILFITTLGVFAQDYLVVPSSKPELFSKLSRQNDANQDKFLFQVDSVVFEFDTLSLPFIDDFTEDHFPTLIKDPLNDSLVTALKFYAIRLLNNDIYVGDGFIGDTSYTYTVSDSGDTISTIPNPVQVIQFFDLRVYPPQLQLLNVFPPYNIFDTLSPGGVDTVFLNPTFVQDSATFYVVEKDTSSFYLDRSAYLNNTMGFYPPSIGVVTFDGLDQFGLPYNFEDIAQTGRADLLTSVPIDLDGTSDSTYFSFFYQAKGLALDGPDQIDSLSLEFFNPNTNRWGLVWQTRGVDLTAPVDSFRQVMIRVDSQFRTPAFQFRFRNLAQLTGAFDNWHVDYIYLDDNRSINDTSQKDISYVYDATSLLVDYQAMPSWHFASNPGAYMIDSVRLSVRNNHDGPLNVFNKIIIPDSTTSPPGVRYIFPGNSQFLQITPFGNLNLTYPINFTFDPADVDTTQGATTILTGICDIDFRPAPIEEPDFIRGNDTVLSKAVLSNYYAYDDGTAEAGYGINTGQASPTAFLAVRFDMPFPDTLGGVYMYFLPQANDIRNQNFKITVWNTLSPPNIIYQQEINSRAIYDEKDGYIPFFLDTGIFVGQTFYIGYERTGQLSLNLGYDLNTNHKNKIQWSYNGSAWNFPSNGIRDGSIMIRPIFRKRNFGIGFNENSIAADKLELVAYPNPTENTFQLNIDPSELDALRLYALDGKMIREYDLTVGEFSVTNIESGLYILQAIGKDLKPMNCKLMIGR